MVVCRKDMYIQDLSNEIIRSYDSANNYTISSVWVSKVDSTLISAINEFAQQLINLVNNGYGNDIKTIIAETQHMNNPRKDGDFENHSYRDLYNFSELIAKHFRSNIDVVNAAHNVMNAINQSVEQENHNKGDYHGISIFLPDKIWWNKYTNYINHNNPHNYFRDYKNLDISNDYSWDDFIYKLYTS